MRSRSLVVRRGFVPWLAIAFGALVAPAFARADEPPPQVPPRGAPPSPAPGGTASPSSVDRLTAEELEILRRRFPDWDQRDAAERERIASNVMKLRLLSPEDRRRLLERAKKLELAGPDAVSALGQKLRGWHEMSHEAQEQMREKRTFFRGMAAQVVAALPPDARQLVTPGALPSSLTFPERLRLEVGIAKLLRKKVEQAYVASPPLDAEPSAGAAPSQAQRLIGARDALRAKGAAAVDDDRRRFASLLFEDRLLALRRRLGAETLDEMRRGERFGALAREAFPDAFAGATDDVARLAAKGRDGLSSLLADGAENERPVSPAQRPLVELVILLERARPTFTLLSADLFGKAERFQGDLLLALGWTPQEVAAFTEVRAEQARWLKLAAFRRWFGVGTGAGHGGGAGGRRGPGQGFVPGGPGAGGQGSGGGWRGAERRGGPPPAPPEVPGMDAGSPGMDAGTPGMDPASPGGAEPGAKPSEPKPPEPGPSAPK